MMSEQITIGEYADVMPDLDDENYQALKESIAKHGLEYPILVDRHNQVIDGHHRLKACQELGIEPETIVVDTEDDVERALRPNLARRDFSSGAKREAVKQYLLAHWDGERSEADVASDLGVAQDTVNQARQELRRDGKLTDLGEFATSEKKQQVRDYLNEHPDASNREVADAIEADVSHVTVLNYRNEWSDDDEDTPRAQSENGDTPRHRSEDSASDIEPFTSQQTDEWSSPRELVEPIADAIGGFDLDPCSGAERSPFASATYTAADDGLTQDWPGTVWVNPPYSDVAAWVDKVIAEAGDTAETVVLLCKGDSSTDWWQRAAADAACILAIDHRLQFGDGENSAPFASHVFVFGEVPTPLPDALREHGTLLSVGYMP